MKQKVLKKMNETEQHQNENYDEDSDILLMVVFAVKWDEY